MLKRIYTQEEYGETHIGRASGCEAGQVRSLWTGFCQPNGKIMFLNNSQFHNFIIDLLLH